MREATRGYVAALLEESGAGASEALAAEVAAVVALIARYAELKQALEDGGLGPRVRRNILEEVIRDRVSAYAASLVGFVVEVEPPGDLMRTLEGVSQRIEAEQARQPGEPDLDPPAGRKALRERVEGFLLRRLAPSPQSELEEIEDGVFRFARLLDSSRELREVLSDPTVDPDARASVARDLIGTKLAQPGVSAICYAVRSARGREVVATLDAMVDMVAAERGRRVADVQVAWELEPDVEQTLRATLSRLVGRDVELRVRQDPAVLGGMVAIVGDVMVDASVRHRLSQLRDAMLEGKVEVGGTAMPPLAGPNDAGTGEPENHG